jgi:esterase/lipase
MSTLSLLGILAIITIIIAIFHGYRVYVGLRKIRGELAHFNYVEEYDSYLDAQPKFYIAQPKRPYAVLLLHGFSASSQVYSTLFEPLEQAQINYYAVTYTGYGSRSPSLLEHVRYTDWLRDTINAYDLLAQTAEKVHVVGMSLGAAFAVMLSQYRPVNKLILLSPALFLESQLKWLVYIGDVPVIRRIVHWFYPFYTKRICVDQTGKTGKLELCSIESLIHTFHHSTIPIEATRAVDKAIRHVNIRLARFKSLVIFYGKKDRVIDTNDLFQLLDKNHIQYTSFSYENSSHVLTLDYDSEQVVNDLIKILQEPSPAK